VRYRTESGVAEANTSIGKFARAVAQCVGVRSGKKSVDCVNGFLNQTKRVSKWIT